MAEAELKILHVTKTLKSKSDAFGYGFSEGMGKALAWCICIGGLVLAIDAIDLADDDQDSTEQVEQ